jgi:hypothetical protein
MSSRAGKSLSGGRGADDDVAARLIHKLTGTQATISHTNCVVHGGPSYHQFSNQPRGVTSWVRYNVLERLNGSARRRCSGSGRVACG